MDGQKKVIQQTYDIFILHHGTVILVNSPSWAYIHNYIITQNRWIAERFQMVRKQTS